MCSPRAGRCARRWPRGATAASTSTSGARRPTAPRRVSARRARFASGMLTRVHRVGLVVRRLEDGLAFWQGVLGLHVSKQATVRDQGVRAALLPIGRSEIELLEPIGADGGVAKFLERRGEGLHHVCFETPDVAAELAAARAKGLPLIDEAPRQGLAGMICFLHPKGTRGVPVELATPPPPSSSPSATSPAPRPRSPPSTPCARREPCACGPSGVTACRSRSARAHQTLRSNPPPQPPRVSSRSAVASRS